MKAPIDRYPAKARDRIQRLLEDEQARRLWSRKLVYARGEEPPVEGEAGAIGSILVFSFLFFVVGTWIVGFGAILYLLARLLGTIF